MSEIVSVTVRSFDKINEIMSLLPKGWRNHWCPMNICACVGGVNCSARMIYKEQGVEPITFEEWQMWVNAVKE